MSKKLSILMLLMTLFVPWAANAQETVTIGDGTSTTYVTPFNSLWGYSFVEQIYTSDEIDMAGSITSISFYLSSGSQTNSIDIFMKNVSRSSFSSSSDYETVTASDMVFTGSVTFQQGWTTITLNTPFAYDGSSNLMIGMHEYTSGYSTLYFNYTTATNAAITFHSDSANPDPYNLGSYSGNSYTSSNRSNIQIEIIPSGGVTCARPTGLTAICPTSSSATLNWTENGDATTWQICLNGNENNLIEVTEHPYTLLNLTPETPYTAKVRAKCSETDQSSWSNTVTFTPSDKTIIGSGTGTNNYLPLSNYYNYSLTQQIYTVAELGTAGLIESIDFYKASTTSASRNLNIYMVSTGKNSFASTSDWIRVSEDDLVFSGTVNFADNDWTTISLGDGFIYDGAQNIAIIVDDNTGSYTSTTGFRSFTASGTQAIYYYSDSNNYDPTGTPGTASSTTTSKNQIRILKSDLSCMPPTNLTATDVTGNSAVLTWQGEAESYNVGYISTVFFEGFEDYSSQAVPTGWTVYKNGTTNSVAWSVYNPSQYLSGVSAHSGNNVAIAFSRPNNQADNWLITPQVELQGTLKFWVRRGTGDSRQDKYEVRLSTTGIDTVDFNVTLKPLGVASDEWEEVTIDLSDYEGQQGYIAIHHYHYGGYYLMIDDFSLSGWVTVSTDTTSFVYENLMSETEYLWRVQSECDEDGESRWVNSSFTTLESCPTPMNVEASYITAHGATFTWTGYSESYTIKVGATTDYGFEDDTICEDFTNSTTYPWTITTSDKHSGTHCVKSASGFTSANSDLKLTVTLEQAGTISFWGKVSSEANVDNGSFLIDNRTQYTKSGISNGWEYLSYDLSAGTHTLTWRYYKNGEGDDGNDCFYVDDIAFTPWSLYTATESPFTLDDATHIQPVTTYSVIIQGNCEDEVSNGSEPISFITACVPVTDLPYTENFNGYSTGTASASTAPSGYPSSHQLPNCWQFPNLSASTSTYPQAFLTSSSAYAVSGKCLLLKSSSQTPLYAVLPEFEAPISDLQLTFTYRNAGVDNSNGTLHVGYMTDPNVDSTFVSLYTCAKTTTKTTETIYFWGAPDNSYIVFKYEGTDNGKILSIDDVIVNQAPSCYPVGTLSYDDLASRTVNLSWTLIDDTQTAWQISVVNGAQERFVNANTNEDFHLGGLTPVTEYTVKVRASCGGNNYGEWSNEITFTTLESCPTPTDITFANLTAVTADLNWVGSLDVQEYTVRYREAAGVNTIFSEDFSNGIGNWTMEGCLELTGVENEVTGTGHEAFRFYYIEYPDPQQNQYLISPEISGITSDAVIQFVYWTNANIYEPERFFVGLSSTDNNIDSFSWSEEITLSILGNQTYYANVPAGTKYIAIKCTSYDAYYLYIDDIVVGFEYEASEWQNATATETNTRLLDLNGGTLYEVQVRSNCLEDEWSDTLSFTTLPSGTKVFVNEGDWNIEDSWIPAGAPTIEESSILRASATITGMAETNKITFEGTPTPTLTINDGGQLKTNFNVNATMKKNITGYGEGNGNYYLMAVPINVTNSAPSNYITITAESNIDLYGWNRTATCEEWQNFKQNSFTLSNGEGYLFADSTDVELSFTGTLKANNVNETKNPDYDAASGGWNLYGNPFACDVYLTTEAEGMAFYRLIDTIFVAATGPIAPMEGFFAQATAAGQTFTITREAPAKCGQLNMSLNHNGSSIDNALIIFGEGQNLGKMSFRENSSKVYMPVNGKDCAAVFTGNVGEMPVNFVAKENGSFTLSFSNENVTFSYLHLIDTITGADVDLLQAPSYSFEASTTDNANRFKVVYTTIKH